MLKGIGCLDGSFSLQIKEDSKPYQALPRCMAYASQKLFKCCIQYATVYMQLGVGLNSKQRQRQTQIDLEVNFIY